jgi:phosphopantothenoylcysteine decarboxylase/phosphopantothenate--cysteine ligase
VKRVDVETAQQMHDAVMDEINDADIFIAAAAVSDYHVNEAHQHKLKKDAATLELQLERTIDILQAVATQHPDVFTVGFAAETRDIGPYAIEKLNRKSLNMIVANDVSRNDIGFDSDSNEVTAYWQGGEQALPKAAKTQLARQLIPLIAKQYVSR